MYFKTTSYQYLVYRFYGLNGELGVSMIEEYLIVRIGTTSV